MATTKATAKPVVPASTSFELDDAQVELLKKKGGRTAQDSPLLDDVKLAVESGKPRGIKITEAQPATRILNHLRKAAEQLDIKIQTWRRDEQGFVGFKHVKPEPEPEAVSE